MNESLVLTIEPDATTAPEKVLGEPSGTQVQVPGQALVQYQGEVALTQQLPDQRLNSADVGLASDVLHVAKRASGSWLAAAQQERHRSRPPSTESFVIVVLVVLAVFIVLICIITLSQQLDRADAFKSEHAFESPQAPMSFPTLGASSSLMSSGKSAMNSLSPKVAGTPPPVSGLGSMESLLRSPFSHNVRPPDMSLRLPTALTVNEGEGATFTIVGRLEPSSRGNFKAEIRKSPTSEVVASLQGTEDEVGSGILISLNKNSPIAFLDTQGVRSGIARRVAIFGAADRDWDATAMPAAVVQQEGQSFVMRSSGQELMSVVTDQNDVLKYVKDNSGRIVAKFLSEATPDPALHIVRGADAGLIMIATVASLKLLDMTHI